MNAQKHMRASTGRRRRLTFGRILQYVFLYTLTFLVLLPVANIFISAFKTNKEVFRSTFFPAQFNLNNFKKVLSSDVFYTGMFSSILLTVGGLGISTILSAMASFPLSRSTSKICLIIYFIFLSAQMIPGASTIIPLYTMLRSMGLLNTRLGLIMVYGSHVSMGILLYTSFFKTVPRGLEEAALIDGCGYFRSFFRILLPILKPVTITYIMVSISGIWNDFFTPEMFITTRSKQPITLAVYSYSNMNGSDWGAIFALMALSVLVPMTFFLVGQKYFFEGMTVGAIKG